MKLIDLINYHIASKSFTSTALSQARACKSFNNLWYTDTQTLKFNNDLSLTCRCCQSCKSELIAHIFACPSHSQTHDEYHPQITAHFRACRIVNNFLKALELGIYVILSDIESHQGGNQRGNTVTVISGLNVERVLLLLLLLLLLRQTPPPSSEKQKV